MEQFVIMIRKKPNSKDIPYDWTRGENSATRIAVVVFNKLFLDMVAVIRVDEHVISGELKPEIVYKQERICKHPSVQGEFLPSGKLVYKCLNCLEKVPVGDTCCMCSTKLVVKEGYFQCPNSQCLEFEKDIFEEAPVPSIVEVGESL